MIPGQAIAADSFSFHNQSSYLDESRILHVLGDIKNESTRPMKDMIITASFYDKSGNLLGQFQRAPSLQVINAGESSSFEIPYINQKTVDSVANYTLSATGQPAEPKAKQLRIISANSRLDLLGTYYINAVARNEGQENATNAIMIATLYDINGKVISIGKALAEAGPGTSDMLPGTEAPFGITITDKLQTYKTARYSLVVDSDNYISDAIVLKTMGSGLSSSSTNNNNQTKSGCLIATAAFGSELAPQVQQLRSFRDGIVIQTLAGNSFMNVFNGWYYSFSPQVADYERAQPWLQTTVRALVYPLLQILDLSTIVYHVLGFNIEMAVVSAGLTASTLIGAIYFAPIAIMIGLINRRMHWKITRVKIPLISALSASLIAIIFAEFIGMPEIMMFGTTLLVLSAISGAILAISKTIRW
jgi:peptide/nickel transport system substrate-binding protein